VNFDPDFYIKLTNKSHGIGHAKLGYEDLFLCFTQF
jgi:hypothetical protein